MTEEKRWMWRRPGCELKLGEHVVLRRLDGEKWLDSESGVEAHWGWWLDYYIWCAAPPNEDEDDTAPVHRHSPV